MGPDSCKVSGCHKVAAAKVLIGSGQHDVYREHRPRVIVLSVFEFAALLDSVILTAPKSQSASITASITCPKSGGESRRRVDGCRVSTTRREWEIELSTVRGINRAAYGLNNARKSLLELQICAKIGGAPSRNTRERVATAGDRATRRTDPRGKFMY
jgi:hypothetical protein